MDRERWKRIEALLDRAFDLPEEQREIVILFHQHDWPIALISQHMDMPEGTIKSHLHRARRKMRELLEQNEVYARSVEEAWR